MKKWKGFKGNASFKQGAVQVARGCFTAFAMTHEQRTSWRRIACPAKAGKPSQAVNKVVSFLKLAAVQMAKDCFVPLAMTSFEWWSQQKVEA